MAYPAGMALRTVTVPAINHFSGVPISGAGTILPARGVIWEATGESFLMSPIRVVFNAGVMSVQLPVTDQPGVVDSDGLIVTDWTYTLAFPSSTRLPDLVFLVPAGAGALQLTPDLATQASAGVATLPSMLSAAVADAEGAAAAAAGSEAAAAGSAAAAAGSAADAAASATAAQNAVGGVLVEDPSDPGTFLEAGWAVSEDPTDEGTYLIGAV